MTESRDPAPDSLLYRGSGAKGAYRGARLTLQSEALARIGAPGSRSRRRRCYRSRLPWSLTERRVRLYFCDEVNVVIICVSHDETNILMES